MSSRSSRVPSQIRSRPVLYVLFAASGAAGLVYEVIWTRELALVFGGTTFAITTVLVAFMTGLGLGSYVSGRIAARVARPARVYGALEIAIGLYGLCVPFLLQLALPLYRNLHGALEGDPGVLVAARFLVGSLVLLVPTTLMGATLPLLVHFLVGRNLLPGRSVAHLYGINTLGAVLGSSLAGFVLIEALGLTRATQSAAALNLLVGLVALLFLDRTDPAPVVRETPQPMVAQPRAEPSPSERNPKRRLRRSEGASLAGSAEASSLTAGQRLGVFAALCISGLTAMAYQIVWTRTLVMCIGSSTYAFTSILTTFILGLGLGSILVAPWVDRWRQPLQIFAGIQLALAVSAIVVKPILGQFPLAAYSLVTKLSESFPRLVAAQFGLIAALVLVPTLLMGAVMPLAVRLLAAGREDSAAITGRAYATNTLGAVLGSFLAGFFLIRGSILGLEGTIAFAAALNAATGAMLLLLSHRSWRTGPRVVIPVALVVVVPLLGGASGGWIYEYFSSAPFLASMDPRLYRERSEVVYYRDGVDLSVAVVENRAMPNNRALTVNGKTDASNEPADMGTQLLLGHIPATLLPAGDRACIIGLGGGFTLAAVARHPYFRSIDCVEISDEVIIAARAYFSPFTHYVMDQDDRVRLVRGDGRNHLLLSSRTYDLIVSEPSNPWIAGVSNLFTREFFELCRSRLSEQGLCAIWLHSYMMTVENFRMIVHTLCQVFPDVSVWQCSPTDYILIGSPSRLRVPLDHLRDRYGEEPVRTDLFRLGITRVEQLLGTYACGGPALRAWAAGAPVVNTDDNAALEFAAPRSMYHRDDYTLTKTLYGIGGDLFEQTVQSSPNEPEDQRIREATARARRSREAFAEAAVLVSTGQTIPALGIMIEAYRDDPSSVYIYRMLRNMQRDIVQRGASGSPEIGALLSAIDELVPPTTQQGTFAGAREISTELRRLAANQVEAGRSDWAIEYLVQARDLDPRDPDAAVELAAALGRAQRFPESHHTLGLAVERGVLDPESLRSDPRLADLLARTDFRDFEGPN